jgi:hypothetical protein
MIDAMLQEHKGHRQACQHPQRVVAQALRHRPGEDAR